MRAAIGFSAQGDTRRALEEVLAQLGRGLHGPAELALVFATSGHAGSGLELVTALGEALGHPALVGGSTDAVISASGEHAGTSGLGVLALSGVRARDFLVGDAAGLRRVRASTPPGAFTLAIPDPRRMDPDFVEALLAPGPGPLVGGALCGDTDARFTASGERVAEGPCALAQLEGCGVRVGTTLGADPASPFFKVTRTKRNWVVELDGEPAFNRLGEYLASMGGQEVASRLAATMLVAVREAGGREGSHAIRSVVGLDHVARAFEVQHPVEVGQELAFAWREALAAARDRKRMLGEVMGSLTGRPIAALYFNSMGRGTALHPEPDSDVQAIVKALPGVPLLGMVSAFELAPVDARPQLHFYGGVLVVLEARD